jgi:hypothetical protein
MPFAFQQADKLDEIHKLTSQGIISGLEDGSSAAQIVEMTNTGVGVRHKYLFNKPVAMVINVSINKIRMKCIQCVREMKILWSE